MGSDDDDSGCFLLTPDLSSGNMTLNGGICLAGSSVVHCMWRQVDMEKAEREEEGEMERKGRREK